MLILIYLPPLLQSLMNLKSSYSGYTFGMIYIKDFENWNIRKKHLDSLEASPYFKEQEVWWVSVGVNIGYEEGGKSLAFSRPVLIIKKFSKNLFVGVPLSTKIKNHPYYVKVKFQKRFITAMIFQLRSFSSKRLIGKIGKIEDIYYQEIKNRICDDIFLPPALAKAQMEGVVPKRQL